MSEVKLAILRFGGDFYDEFFDSLNEEESLICLCLWPVSQKYQIKYPNVRFIQSIEFIQTNDHFELAEFVTHFTNNWWSLLGYGDDQQEIDIDGLKITEIFNYELEQTLTYLCFSVRVITRAIEKYRPDSLVFLEYIKHEDYRVMNLGLTEGFESFQLSHLFLRNSCRLEQIFLKASFSSSRNKILQDRFKRVSSKGVLFIAKKLKEKLGLNKWQKASIVISNSNRCLQKFEEVAKKKYPVYVLTGEEYKHQTNDLKLHPPRKDWSFDGISFMPFLKDLIPIIENRFYNLSNYFDNLRAKIREKHPIMYVTVNVGNSKELIKMRAFQKEKVRTVYGSEGLGAPNDKINIVYDSILRPNLEVERWVFSETFKNSFKNFNKPTYISGYLDDNINSVIKPRTELAKRKNRKIVFALSTAKEGIKRAIENEDMFEILRSVSDMTEVVSQMPNTELILKLHPGDSINLKYYKEIIENKENVRIITYCDFNDLLMSADVVVVYSTSVTIEALYRGKNVICYNYTGRPSLTTTLKGIVNDDPNEGPAIVFVDQKEKLEETINYLMENSNPSGYCKGLERVLYNVAEGYEVERIINKLLDSE